MTRTTPPTIELDRDAVAASQVARWARDLAGHLQQLTVVDDAPDGLLAWGCRFLPQHFRRPPSQMHLWLGEQLDRLGSARGVKLNVIGPRGGAKSTLGTLACVLRAAIAGTEPYIWIVSATRHQAVSHLENVKQELVANALLRQHYPATAGRGSPWRGNRVTLRSGVTIEAFGTGQRIRGRRSGASRPTLIVCDDVQNDQHMESARQRQLSRQWFHGTLLKAGSRRTNIINLATALHRDALAMELCRTAGWKSRVFRAIERWPDNMSLWAEWEAIYCDLEHSNSEQRAREFYQQNAEAMQAGAELLWPEEEDLYTLMCMRVESGRTAFEREKQGSPANPDLYEWPEDYFDESIWFDAWPAALQLKVVAIDPSKGQSAQRGDYSAIVQLGVDAQGLLLVEADLARRPTPQMVADAVAACRQFRPEALGIEVNQYQDLLVGELSAEFARQDVMGVPPWTIDNRVNKHVRIRRLGPYLSTRRLRFKSNSPGTGLLVDQLREFPVGDHDDGPDGLEMAIRMAGLLLESRHAGDGLGDTLPLSV